MSTLLLVLTAFCLQADGTTAPAATSTAPVEFSSDQAHVSRDVGTQGNLHGGALPDVGDELAWRLPDDFVAGVYRVVVVGRSGAREEGLDFVAAYRVTAPDRAFPRGVKSHELKVFVPDGVQPLLRGKGEGYYVFEAPMQVSEKLYLRPGDEVRVNALVGWAHVWRLRAEPVPPEGQHDLAVRTDRLASLFSLDEPARFTVTVTNWQEERRTLRIEAVVLDEDEREAARVSREVRLDGRSAVEAPLDLHTRAYGPFYAHLSLHAGDRKLAELVRGFGVTSAPRTFDVPDSSPFGIHKSDLRDWPLIGAKWVRLWDTGDTWNVYELERGRFRWEKLDAKIAAAQRNDVKVLYVFAYTPTWASARPEEGHYTGAGATAEPRKINDWRNFVREVARRYKGRIAAYEVWNEPNAGFFSGTVEAYERLLEAAYEVLKQEDPAARVLGLSATGSYFEWMEQAFKLGALKHMDVVSVHTYTTPRSPEEVNLVGRYEGTHRLIKQYGAPRPVWNTEVGLWQPEREGGRPMTEDRIVAKAPEQTRPNWTASWPYRPITEQAAAEYCVRTYLITMACGVERLFWYSWVTQSLPMYTDLNEPRLLAVAYGGMTARLSRARFRERIDLGSRDLFFLVFDTPSGPLAVAWSAQRNPTKVTISSDGHRAKVYDLWGNARVSREAQLPLTLTGRPVYVEGLTIESLRRIALADEEVVLQSVEAEVSTDVGETNVKEHTSGPHHGPRRVMGLPDAGDAITWTMPPTLPLGEYELCVDGFTGTRPPGTDYVSNYRIVVQAGGEGIELALQLQPGVQPDSPCEGRWYGPMTAEKSVRLGPGDRVTISSRARWAFVGPLKLHRLKAAESKERLSVPRLPAAPVLDGDPWEWRSPTWLHLDRREQVWIGVADRFASTSEKDAWQGADDCSGCVLVGWSKEGLALFVEVRDDRLVPPVHGVEPWEADCVEIFLDARSGDHLGSPAVTEGVYQLFCPAPRRTGSLQLLGKAPEGTQAFGKVTENNYTLELLVPTAALGPERWRPGRSLGFDVAIDDADAQVEGKPIRKSQLVYHGTADNFQDPSAYAILVLEP